MISLKSLEQRLTTEMPAFIWSCQPVDAASVLPSSQIPEQIEVTATRRDEPGAGNHWRFNGSMLFRWGIDATAKLICSEYPETLETGMPHVKPGWDKLAEI
jgi:hypothetical protein